MLNFKLFDVRQYLYIDKELIRSDRFRFVIIGLDYFINTKTIILVSLALSRNEKILPFFASQ